MVAKAPARVWFKIHLYIGLILGLPFAFLGLTGSLLVFDHAIDEQLNSAQLLTARGGEFQKLSEIVAAAKRAAPAGAEPARLYMPRVENSAVKIAFNQSTEAATRRIEIAIDPYTAEVLGRREYGHYLMSFLYKLHHTLWLGAAGETAVGILGLFLFSALVTGLYLWWPRRGQIRRAFTVKRGTSPIRFFYDLHKLGGFCVALILAVIAFTGVYMVFPQYVRPLVDSVSPLSDPAATLAASGQAAGRPITMDRAVNSARQVFPEAELQRIYFPENHQGPYEIVFRQAGEVRKTAGSSQVWVDQYSGEVVYRQEPASLSPGDRFLIWMFPLHNGEAFGLIGRTVVFVCGAFPMFLYATGMIVWWKKRQRRRLAKA